MNPFELADYAMAGLTLLIGLGIGRRMRPRQPAPPRPICSCSHGYGSHEDGKECQASVKVESKWDRDGYVNGWSYVACSCHQYDGPDPVVLGLMNS